MQVSLNRGLADAIVADGLAWLVFSDGNRSRPAMNPTRAAVEEVLEPALQRFHQMLRALQSEADHIDDDVGLQRLDLGAKAACGFLVSAVHLYAAYGLPCPVRLVGVALSAAHDRDIVASLDKAGYEECPYVSCPSNHNDSHLEPPLFRGIVSQVDVVPLELSPARVIGRTAVSKEARVNLRDRKRCAPANGLPGVASAARN